MSEPIERDGDYTWIDYAVPGGSLTITRWGTGPWELLLEYDYVTLTPDEAEVLSSALARAARRLRAVQSGKDG
jgi:hypothetical protein